MCLVQILALHVLEDFDIEEEELLIIGAVIKNIIR